MPQAAQHTGSWMGTFQLHSKPSLRKEAYHHGT